MIAPRCGWRGYFHHYLATVDGDWGAAVCDNCYADLHPDITVMVKFYAVRVPRHDAGGGEAVAVIRQRDRSDHDYPDVGHFPVICCPESTFPGPISLVPAGPAKSLPAARGSAEWDVVPGGVCSA